MLDCTHKFRDFLGSARAFRRLSDRVCLEKGLSIIEHPKQHSKVYLAEYRADIDTHRAARATFTRLLGGGKLPKLDALKQEHNRLAAERKAARRDYAQAKEEMREAMTAKANIDHLLSITGGTKNKEMERSDMTQRRRTAPGFGSS
jgi:hypothetical protein